MIEWGTVLVTAITTLLSVSGIGWMFTIREDKKAKRLDNEEKQVKIEDFQKDQAINEWKDIANERKHRAEELKDTISKHEARIDRDYETIDKLKTQLGEKNKACAVADILRCVKIECPSREPKISTIQHDISKDLGDKME